ncbi:HNH endonuclease [Streptomyces xanthophaeus]|uniref:HNH endonuclease n=1 Tax=Streptomyces xanthophaeus TaxID=67385 RepID=UPI00386D0B4F|nr:HNH endonuclease [Streptomyces xanthophaeus]WST63145.1 HNH endonuclease [Streptomyces xanthophaeus]
MDHIQPLALSGTGTDGNVQPLCRPCHRLKTREHFGASGAPLPGVVLPLCPPCPRCPTGGGDQGNEPSGDALDGQVQSATAKFEVRGLRASVLPAGYSHGSESSRWSSLSLVRMSSGSCRAPLRDVGGRKGTTPRRDVGCPVGIDAMQREEMTGSISASLTCTMTC